MSRPLPGTPAQLVSFVHVYDERGNSFAFGPGGELPEWAARKMGAHVFEGGTHPFDEDGDGQSDRESGVEPARNGKGSGRDAWVSFAHEKGRGDLATGSRDEIVAALIDAGVIEKS